MANRALLRTCFGHKVPPAKRLAALALRTTLQHTLQQGCAYPPVWYEHDEYDVNNLEEEAPPAWVRCVARAVTEAPPACHVLALRCVGG